MDPETLDLVGQSNVLEYGGPWALVVVRHGYLVAEWLGVPAMPHATFDLWSATKSVTGIAFGLLLEDSRNNKLPNGKKLGFDSPAYDFVPEGHPFTDPRKAEITIGHLLTMTSGIPGEDHGTIGIEVVPGRRGV